MEVLTIILNYAKRILNNPYFRVLVWYPHLLMLTLMVAFLIYGDRNLTLFINPLPSDERMIAHFYAHREAFETLVQRFRNMQPRPDEAKLTNDPENRALMEQAGIYRVDEYGGFWFPSPYSYEGWQAQDRQFRNAVKTDTSIDYRSQYHNTRVILKDETLGRVYRTRVLFPPPLLQSIDKYYIYFPYIPRIAHGRVMDAVESNGKSKLNEYVYASLNNLPWFWPNGRTIYRQIEGHWFLAIVST